MAKDRMISTVDPEARHMRKSRSEYRDGYKAHIAILPEDRACMMQSQAHPGQAVASMQVPTGPELYPLSSARSRTPMVLGGANSNLSRVAVRLWPIAPRREHLFAGIKPWPLQTAVPGGFDRDDFVVDHDADSAGLVPPGSWSTIKATLRCPSSPLIVVGAHCASAAPPPNGVERSTSLFTTKSSLSAERRGAEVSSKRTTNDSARWSSVRSRGWSPMHIAACASAESRGTDSGSHFASPL